MRLFPSRTIALYTARLLLTRSAAFLAGLVVILMTLDLLGESSKILAVHGNTDADLWHYVGLRVPQLIALFLPFAVLLGTLVTLATLNANSEVIIFKAAGISAHQILAPLIVAAFGIAVVNFTFNEAVVVKANKALAAWQAVNYGRIAREAPALTEVWVRGGDDLFHAETVTGTGPATILHGVTIYDRAGDRLITVLRSANARPIVGGWRLVDVRAFDVAKGVERRHPMLDFQSAVEPAQFTTTVVTPAYTAFWDLLPGDPRAARRGQAGDAARRRRQPQGVGAAVGDPDAAARRRRRLRAGAVGAVVRPRGDRHVPRLRLLRRR